MDAEELRQFSAEELKGRVRQWRDELFRSRFKNETAEAKDTSVFRKLRLNIARGLTVLGEKSGNAPVVSSPAKAMEPQAQATVRTDVETPIPVEEKPVKRKTTSVAKKPAAKKTKSKE